MSAVRFLDVGELEQEVFSGGTSKATSATRYVRGKARRSHRSEVAKGSRPCR